MVIFSQDLRDRVLKGLKNGERVSSIATRLDVSERWVYLVKLRYERYEESTPRQVGGYRQSVLAGQEQQIRGWIEEQPDLTLSQLCERLAEDAVNISVSALWYQLDNWGVTFKKNPARLRTGARGRTSRTD